MLLLTLLFAYRGSAKCNLIRGKNSPFFSFFLGVRCTAPGCWDAGKWDEMEDSWQHPRALNEHDTRALLSSKGLKGEAMVNTTRYF